MMVSHRRLRQNALGVNVHRLLVLFKCLGMAKGLVDQYEFDVICCVEDTNILGVLLGRLARVVVVADSHSANYLEQNSKFMRFLAELSERLVCVTVDPILVPTPELKAHYVSWGTPSGKIHVIRNALDVADFKPTRSREDVRRELGIENDEIISVFLGNLRVNYNIDTLVKLHEVSKLLSTAAKIRFLIIGDYDRKPVLDENFIYTGYVQVLPDYLRAGDFAILPIFFNSLGIRSRCVLYFASSLPVITTPVGITGMQFAEEAGVAIVRDSIEDMALATLELIRSPYQLRKMKDDCKGVMDQFNPKLIAEQLHEAFTSTEISHPIVQ
jgi:glycosyltransferase involved in cell wall biosynthesis